VELYFRSAIKHSRRGAQVKKITGTTLALPLPFPYGPQFHVYISLAMIFILPFSIV
jgi:hypothetical protein